MKSKKLYFALATMMGAVLLAGCSSDKADTTTEVTTEATTEAATEAVVFGEQSEDAYQVSVTNQMGNEITSMKVISKDGDEIDMLGSDGQIAEEETVLCYFPKDKIKNPEECKLAVKLSDQTEYELSAFQVADMDEVSLYYENEVGYLVYTSKATGEEVKTKAAELEIKKIKTAVNDFSEKLNAVTDDDENLEETVTSLRETYDAFTDEQKDLVDEKDVERLEELEALVQKKKQSAAPKATSSAPAAQPAAEPAPAPEPAEPSGGGCLDDVLINEW